MFRTFAIALFISSYRKKKYGSCSRLSAYSGKAKDNFSNNTVRFLCITKLRLFWPFLFFLTFMGHIIPRLVWNRGRGDGLSLYMSSIKAPYFFQNCYRALYRTFPVSLVYRLNIHIKDYISSCTKTCPSYSSS